MKCMKVRGFIYFKSIYRAIGPFLVLLLLNSACSLDDMDSVPQNSSGSSSNGATYAVKGKIMTSNSKPIKNILIEVPYEKNITNTPSPDVLYTDDSGNFEWKRNDAAKDQTFLFITSDIDGDENQGHFKTDTTYVRFTLKDLSESGGNGIWDKGNVLKTIEIRMERKE